MATSLRLVRQEQRLLRNRPVVAYTRKSREQGDFQVHSLERQRDAIEAYVIQHKLGDIDEWFADEQSGKDFVRPGYDALLRFCELHPQPTHALGTVVCLDYDRFSRPVDESLKVSPLEYQRQVIRLKDAGWELDFVLTPRSGNALLDGITSTIKASMAGEYLEKLSHNVRDGRRKGRANGTWLGGPAPFPTVRYNVDDTTYKRPLGRKDHARNGQSVLGPDLEHPEYRQYWEQGARMILSGASLQSVARQYDAWGVPQHMESAKTGKHKWGWTSAHMRLIYRNPALVGQLRCKYKEPDGTVRQHLGDAQWGALVDEELFWQVQRELQRRMESRSRGQRGQASFLLVPQCLKCGVNYFGYLRTNQGGTKTRVYGHPSPKSKLPAELVSGMVEEGCRGWHIGADIVDNAVRDLIREKRLSEEFYTRVVDMMDNHDQHERDANALEDAARRRVESLQSQKEGLKKALRFAETDDERGELMEDIRKLTAEIGEAQIQCDQAHLHAQNAQKRFKDLLATVEEAQHLIDMWDIPGEQGEIARRRLVDLWVLAVYIEVDAEAGTARRNPRTLHVVLATDPTNVIPVKIDIPPQATQLGNVKKGKKFFTLTSYAANGEPFLKRLTTF
jgi:DNA invertase Pin-like site-specific DNA recombinase/predicted  nucleic acid-binding Zn-ribbon protein